MKYVLAGIALITLPLAALNANAFCLFGCEPEITPESAVEKLMASKGVLEGGQGDLTNFFTPEYVNKQGQHLYEAAFAAKLIYGTFSRIEKFSLKANSREVKDSFQSYLISAPDSHLPLEFRVECAMENQKMKSCLIADIKKLRK